MTNKAGIFGGFAFGTVGFLVMFKLLILDKVPPSDELAPGIVVVTSVLNGFLFAFVGHWIQNRLGKRITPKESK